jgi:chemotaxis protein MotB
MQANGLAKDQVSQVRGFADQQLRKPEAPFDASNRRISVIVHYLEKSPAQIAGELAAEAVAGGEKEGESKTETKPGANSKSGGEPKPKSAPGKKE